MSNITQEAKTLLQLITDTKSSDGFELLKSKISKFDQEKYPDLRFTLEKEEIQFLGKHFKDDIFNWTAIIDLVNRMKGDEAAIVKLLLGHLWKQGEFKKNTNILHGILNSDNAENDENGTVFYYFGKHLSNPLQNPIIDKNIISFWRWHYSKYDKNLNTYRYGVKKMINQ